MESKTLVRAGLQALLEREPWVRVAGDAERADEAVRRFARVRPDAIIVANELRGESGLDLIPRLAEACPGARIVVITTSHDPEIHRRAKRLGAHVTLTKYESPRKLFEALETSRATSRHAKNRSRDAADDICAQLTKREREVLDLVVAGLRNREIAERLFISEGTVRRHLNATFAKTGVTNRIQLVIQMRDRGR